MFSGNDDGVWETDSTGRWRVSGETWAKCRTQRRECVVRGSTAREARMSKALDYRSRMPAGVEAKRAKKSGAGSRILCVVFECA